MTRSIVEARNAEGTSGTSRTTAGRREMWHSSFEATTASAIALRKGWMSTDLASGGSLVRRFGEADALGEGEIDGPWNADWYRAGGLASVLRDGGNIAPIWSRANGAASAVVAVTWMDEYQGIFCRADAGIRDLDDLRGKRLGLPLHRDLTGFQGAVALHGLLTGLELGGIRPKQVTFVDSVGAGDAGRGETRVVDGVGISEDRQIAALLSGTVDVIFLRGTAGIRAARDARLRAISNLNEHPDPLVRLNNATLRPVTVERAFLDAHPEVVTRYLALLLRTAEWAEHHHDEVVGLLASEASDAGSEGGASSRDEILEVHGPEVHRSFAPKLSHESVRGLEEQKNFLRDWKFLTADFSIANWLVAEPLVEAQRIAQSQSPNVGVGVGVGVSADPYIDDHVDVDVDVDVGAASFG